MNKFKILLMYSGVLDIPAREGHDALSGVSMEYFFYGENGEQLEPKVSVDGVSGIRRGKVFMQDPAVANKVSYVPGIYDGTFEMQVGADGKPVLKLVDVDFLGKASIKMMDEKPASK